MKKIIRCKKCGERVVYFGTGFTKERTILCTKFDQEVDPDDGCTFGSEGDPIHKPVRYNIIADISGHPAVYGDPFFNK